MIRVIVVDDSSFVRGALAAVLGQDPEIEVIATAQDGVEAVELVQRHRPNIVTMDVNMPRMNGYEAVEQIMALCPTPIVIVTASPSKQDKEGVVKALALGALDVFPKPDLAHPDRSRQAIAELIAKLKTLSQARVIRHVAGLRRLGKPPSVEFARPDTARCVIAIGCSTGGPAALERIFSSLPGDLHAALVVAQHITEGFTATLVQWLASVSELRIAEGQAGVSLQPGIAWIAPSARHMRVSSRGALELLDLPPVRSCKPSADLLLSSVAAAFGPRAVGIVLTGMGNDGTEGMTAIRHHGGTTLAQDESTSAIFGMPKSAIDAGVVDKVLALDAIPAEIVRLAGTHAVAGTS